MFGIYKKEAAPGAVFCTDLPVPQMGENDILVRVRAAAICGTDLHIMQWDDFAAANVPAPMVFGHEFSGDVVGVGSSVKEIKVGDRVAGETHIPCNSCYQCKTDNRHICDNMKVIGVHTPGAFAEYISFPQDCAYKITDQVDYITGAILEPMGMAVHGVSAAQVQGKNVLIYGCGPIGLMAINAAKVRGANKIIAADIVEEKLTAAKKMGADLVFDDRKTDTANEVRGAFGGIGADVVIDFTGNCTAIVKGFQALRKGGRIVLVGIPGKELSLNILDNVIYKEATIIGVTGRLMYQTWHECEEILASPDFDLSPVVGGIYPMNDFKKAFADIEAGKPGKMLLITE